jgi:hypothetical protein
MEQEPKTRVHFRKFHDGQVLALFPDECWNAFRGDRTISSYMHVGQHSEASSSLIADLDPATLEEYADLKAELEAEPYKYVLEVMP